MATIEDLERALDLYVSMIQLDWDRNCAAYPDIPVPTDIGWVLAKSRSEGYSFSVMTILPAPIHIQHNFRLGGMPLEELLVQLQEHMARMNDAMTEQPIMKRNDGVEPLPLTKDAEWDIDADLDAANLRIED